MFLEQSKTKTRQHATDIWFKHYFVLTDPRKLSNKTRIEPKAPRLAPKEQSANHEGSETNSASNLPAKEWQIVTGHYGRSCATGEREREKKPRTIWANEESKGRKEVELHILYIITTCVCVRACVRRQFRVLIDATEPARTVGFEKRDSAWTIEFCRWIK